MCDQNLQICHLLVREDGMKFRWFAASVTTLAAFALFGCATNKQNTHSGDDGYNLYSIEILAPPDVTASVLQHTLIHEASAAEVQDKKKYYTLFEKYSMNEFSLKLKPVNSDDRFYLKVYFLVSPSVAGSRAISRVSIVENIGGGAEDEFDMEGFKRTYRVSGDSTFDNAPVAEAVRRIFQVLKLDAEKTATLK
jgi:hypothetical protein